MAQACQKWMNRGLVENSQQPGDEAQDTKLKGRKVVPSNTGGEGFIPSDMLVFKSGTKFRDNHNDKNYSKYEKRLNGSQY